jgi:hypothetical protein
MKVTYLLSQAFDLGVRILDSLHVYTASDFQLEAFPEIHSLGGRPHMRKTCHKHKPKGVLLSPLGGYPGQIQGPGHALGVGADWTLVLS